MLAVPTDVTRWKDVDRLAAGAYERFGAVHVSATTPASSGTGSGVGVPLEEWEWIVGVNLWGAVHGIKAFVPRMIESAEEGHIVNTASLGGLIAFPRISMYSAAKAGVVGLSESLHHDLRNEGVPIGIWVLCCGAGDEQPARAQPGSCGRARPTAAARSAS